MGVEMSKQSTLSHCIRQATKDWNNSNNSAAMRVLSAKQQKYHSGGGGVIINILVHCLHADLCTQAIHDLLKSHFERHIAEAGWTGWNAPSLHIIYRDPDGHMIHPKQGG